MLSEPARKVRRAGYSKVCTTSGESDFTRTCGCHSMHYPSPLPTFGMKALLLCSIVPALTCPLAIGLQTLYEFVYGFMSLRRVGRTASTMDVSPTVTNPYWPPCSACSSNLGARGNGYFQSKDPSTMTHAPRPSLSWPTSYARRPPSWGSIGTPLMTRRKILLFPVS